MSKKKRAPSIWPDGVGSPAQRAMAGAGIHRWEDLGRWPEAEIALLHGMGPKAMGQLHDGLAARSLGFAEPSLQH